MLMQRYLILTICGMKRHGMAGEALLDRQVGRFRALQNLVDVDRGLPVRITTLFLGQPDAALAYLEKWLRLDPHRPNLFFIHYWLGHDHLLLAQADEAVESLMRALSANPCFPSHSHLLLAAALGLKADTERANVAIAEWVKCSPKAGSIAAVRLWEGAFPWAKQPEYVALREKTEYAGLRRGGMPEQ
jgi:adenylate cyclase